MSIFPKGVPLRVALLLWSLMLGNNNETITICIMIDLVITIIGHFGALQTSLWPCPVPPLCPWLILLHPQYPTFQSIHPSRYPRPTLLSFIQYLQWRFFTFHKNVCVRWNLLLQRLYVKKCLVFVLFRRPFLYLWPDQSQRWVDEWAGVQLLLAYCCFCATQHTQDTLTQDTQHSQESARGFP